MAPFNTKGLVYQGAWDYYQQTVPGGAEAVQAALSGEAAGVFRPPFLAASWFDALPIVEISRVAARLSDRSHKQLVIENASWLAQRDVHGVYRAILKLASPSMVATSLPKAALRYFDFGEASGHMTSPKLLEASQHGVPRSLATWMMWAVEGFAPVALEIAGAKKVQVLPRGVTPFGVRDGIETVTIRFTIDWA